MDEQNRGDIEYLARMTNYPYWHQIEESQSDEQRHWWQALCHRTFQRHHQQQTQDTEEEQQRA